MFSEEEVARSMTVGLLGRQVWVGSLEGAAETQDVPVSELVKMRAPSLPEDAPAEEQERVAGIVRRQRALLDDAAGTEFSLRVLARRLPPGSTASDAIGGTGPAALLGALGAHRRLLAIDTPLSGPGSEAG